MADRAEDAAHAVEQRIDAARETLGDKAGRVREKLAGAADDLKQKAEGLGDRIRDTDWNDVASRTRQVIRDNPVAALAIAAGVGFALGLLLRRDD